jgi:hypothetical protein
MSKIALRRRNDKRWMSCLLVAALVISHLPFPIPDVRLPSISEVAFPCQSRPCGCKTARQCWTTCCCFTPAQRLQWAKENGVTPPSFAVLPDDAGNSPARQLLVDDPAEGSDPPSEELTSSRTCCSSSGPERKSCCGDCQETACELPACELPAGKLAASDCCKRPTSGSQEFSKQSSCCGSEKFAVDSSIEEREVAIVISVEAMRCGGSVADCTNLPWAIWLKPKSLVRPARHLEYSLKQPTMRWVGVWHEPPIPPPRAIS